MKILPPVSIETRRFVPDKWDVVAAVLVIGFIVALADASRTVILPLARIQAEPLSLAPAALPYYALLTALRMLIALGVSLVFTFTYATLAAKSARAGALLIPLLDILQSVPILSFISVTTLFFLSLAPGMELGAEFVVIFAIFTSQAWNMAFSFYQSLRTVPAELMEAGRMFGLTGWGRFWRIEVPFAMPALIWNMMMSMSGAWFFITVAEAISVGHINIAVPGIGSYIALAISRRDLPAIGWAILAMAIVILIFDQLLFRPLVSWADRFKIDVEPSEEAPESWALMVYRRSRLLERLTAPFAAGMRRTYRIRPPDMLSGRGESARRSSRRGQIIVYTILGLGLVLALWKAVGFVGQSLSLADVGAVIFLGLLTALRVFVLIALASLIWTPIGIYVGLRPRLTAFVQPVAQFLAAFPSNLFFPIAVSAIVAFRLNPDIWLSPLMILGTQWYILFNVIAGASALPRELRYASQNLHVGGWLWWRRVALPMVFPYYVTGAITASGGSWNAAVVAELASWGNRTVEAHGLGAYIMQASNNGDFHRIVLGTLVMSGFVVIINRVLWRPLYNFAERKFRLT
ncbi:MAG: ABC transporter permease subunit [Alphaproteobacteria bacterium]|nr:ABC transporter permease subunit [Alphaproteobacteria bacterium]